MNSEQGARQAGDESTVARRLSVAPNGASSSLFTSHCSLVRRGLLIGLCLLAALWALACCLARPIVDAFAFPRPPRGAAYPDTVPVELGGGAVGRLRVVHNPDSPWAVLYFHGNGEDLAETDALVRALARHATVYAADYRGYGQSTGKPSVRTFEADARAFHDAAVAQGADPARLVVQGYSLGTAAATEVAATRPVAALILGGGFTSILAVPGLAWCLPCDWLRSEDKLPRVACPVWIFHGTADRLIPLAHGEALHAAAREPKRFTRLPGDNHRTAHRHDADQLAQCLAWLETLAQSRERTPRVVGLARGAGAFRPAYRRGG